MKPKKLDKSVMEEYGIESEDDEPVKKPRLIELDRYSDEETDSETEALQEAFARGDLKPGLNILEKEKKKYANNVGKMKKRLEEITLDLPWIEKLDVICKPASIAPELAKQLEETNLDSIVRDDFKRESLFYRQAQAAVMNVIPRLHLLGIPTKRPEDYFAEMAKSDSHMQKIKSRLIEKKAAMERIEKVRQIRKQKKMQKAIQAESKLKKQNAKKELDREVKKFRKGERKDLSFLEDKPTAPLKRKVNKKRQRKDQKYGHGGRKRNQKWNTKESLDGGVKKKGGPKKLGAKKPTKMNRPGKEKRKNMRNKKR